MKLSTPRPALGPVGTSAESARSARQAGPRAARPTSRTRRGCAVWPLQVERADAWCLRSRPGRACPDQFPELANSQQRCVAATCCSTASSSPSTPPATRLPPPAPPLSATDARSATRLAAAHAATLIIFDLLHLDDSSPALSYARRTLLEQELPATVRPGGRRLRSSATSRRCWRSRASSGSRESWPRASTPPTSPATEPAVVQAQPPPPPRNPSRSPAGGQRRPTRVAQGPSSSRAESDSTLIPAGSAELGLTGAEREQLRRRRAAPPSPSATLLRAVARIASIPESGSMSTSMGRSAAAARAPQEAATATGCR